MNRPVSMIATFAVAVTAYWLYALAVVPLVEPPARARQQQTGEPTAERAGYLDDRVAALAELFPADSWALKEPKILESDQVQLLMQSYHNLGDGRVELQPCAMIFLPDEPGLTETERRRRALVLEAPAGALLEFDRPLDLRRAEVGQLVGGRLQGPITIRGRGKSPTSEDDLLITTRDVELTEHTVATPHPVSFRLGPHHGSGRHLRIELLSHGGKGGAPRIDGIKTFRLRQVDRLHVELDKLPTTEGGRNVRADGSDDQRQDDSRTDRRLVEAGDAPLEITCRGPFLFDVPAQRATFEDHVDVIRLNPEGPSDQLSCELLTIFFIDEDQPPIPERRALKETAKRDSHAPSRLKPHRIEARGDPAVVTAPSRDVHVRGQRLEYNLETGQIVLEGSREVMLRQGQSEVYARRVVYQPGEDDRLGRVAADGPGRLHAQSEEDPAARLDARWNKHLHVYPHDGSQVIALAGQAALSSPDTGELLAEEIFFWLEKQDETMPDTAPAAPRDEPPRAGWRPDRMLARDDVRIHSEQLDGAVRQLEVWFEQLDAPGGPRWRPASVGGENAAIGQDRSRLRPTARLQRSSRSPNGRTTTLPTTGGASGGRHAAVGAAGPVQATPLARGAGAGSADAAVSPPPGAAKHGKQRFDIAGHVLRARVLLGEATTQLAELAVQGEVRFTETHTSRPGERPVFIRGDQLHVIDAETPRAAVTIVGRDAMFEGRGMTILAPQIHVNRGTNRLTIDGAGRMKLPVDRDLQGQPLHGSAELWIAWQDRMNFDGRVARFEESVVATTDSQRLLTEMLEVQFQKPIRFDQDGSDALSSGPADRPIAGSSASSPYARAPHNSPEPTPEQILCRGGVRMESRMEDHGHLVAREQFELGDLTVNLINGATSGGGPGWLMSVREADAALPGMPPAAVGARPERESERGLRQLYIRFQDRISGNVHQRRVTFHGTVRTIYLPVDQWEPSVPSSDPAELGPRSLVMSCDQLTVAQTPHAGGRRAAVEMEAAGNTLVESAEYTARAARITYAEAKDMLVLEGDGRTDAQLFRQQEVGGPTSKATAQRILYWPGTNRLKVDGARSLELSQFRANGTAPW